MPNVITARLDVTMIDKARLFQGRKKNKKDVLPQYLDIVLMPSKPTNFGDYRDEQTHMVVQSVTKEEREKNIRGEILGNAKELTGRDRRQPATPAAGKPAGAPPEAGSSDLQDDIPF